LSSSLAVSLAKKHDTRLHVLHISTAKELELFNSTIPLKDKKITAEACIHHLWFDDSYYKEKGTFIKWNPAVKSSNDRKKILEAVKNNVIDIIATDHAPHTIEEKQNVYTKAPSGGPLVQHALVALFELHKRGEISITDLVRKTSHDVATCFKIKDRGYLREGYFADIAIVDPNSSWEVTKENIMYKCGWSPFQGNTFSSKIVQTFVSGHLAYNNNELNENTLGKRLFFNK